MRSIRVIHSPRVVALCIALFALFHFAERSNGQILISEFLTESQTNTTVDEDGDHSDWIELLNTGAMAQSLNGWYLTDDPNNLRKWRFPLTTPVVSLGTGGRLVVFASNKNRKLYVNKLHTNFKLSNNAGSYLAIVQPDGLTIAHSYTYPQQVQDISYGIPTTTSWQTLVAAGANGKAKVPQSSADYTADLAAGWNSNPAFNDSGWQSGQTGFGYDTTGSYGTLIGPGGDLQAAMYNVNSCALVRIPFNVADPASVTALRLSMKFDDGFNCWLNGHQIQTYLSGGQTWNSGALIDRSGNLTTTYQVFNPLNNPQQWLVAGTNILAFQILNYTNGSTQDTDLNGVANGSRTLCLPFLEGNIAIGQGSATYLATATGGTVNSGAISALGPSISNATSSAARPVGGAGSAPIIISAKVVPSIKPLKTASPVNLKYAIMYATEVNVVMKDDGIAPDAVAGDGVYTAQIPTTSLAPGQMVRWRITATDNVNTTSTQPPFRNTLDNDQYYGTIALDGITTSQLSLLHMFVNPASVSPTYLPGTSGGTRCSFYYVERNADGTYQPGHFYDNVQVDLHGQSTAGFPVNKKSHDVNFSHDNQFRWKTGESTANAINLLTNYADKSKLRNTMAYETFAGARHIASHFSFPVRVQQNAAFWGIYDLTENGSSDFLKRTGLDPNGALYKIYDTFSSTAYVEKKTGEPISDTSDLASFETALDTGVALATRRQYGFDKFDIPTMINYLAVNDLMNDNDQGHKNCYIYRDTFGTGEWSILPWDLDLSFGHTWTGGKNYFDDDIDAQRPLRNGADNRLKELVWQSPEMNAMYLRRLRTLMDQYFISANATNGPWETRINQVLDQLDPPGLGSNSDAYLDMLKWGYWLDAGNGTELGVGAYTPNHFIRPQAARIVNNNPAPSADFPGANPYVEYGYTSLPPFISGRRQYLYTMNPNSGGFPIPAAQPTVPTGLVFEQIDFNPSSGNQDQEYFIIRNNSANYVDVSGWKITGAVTCTFRGGTVIPPFTSGSAFTAPGDVHAGRLHIARNPAQFRARAVSPRGNEYRLVVGPYSGQLSARGDTINLVIPGATPAQDVVVATTTYAGAPTTGQNFLRVTELSYAPLPPTPTETTALPGVQAGDFEFIELMNTSASALNIGGASFDKGLTFTFPTGFTLQPGQRCVVVSLIAAFNLRYPSSGAIVAGQFDGSLSNSGETIELLDPVGETILNFDYDPLWFGIPKAGNAAVLTEVAGY